MTLTWSRHNIIGQMAGSAAWFIVNPLAGSADLLSPQEAASIKRGEFADKESLVARGYLVEPEEEARRLRRAFIDFAKTRERDEVQIFFAPSYACNFACAYCYQSSYEENTGVASPEVIAAFFAYLDTAFADRRAYLTLFGGEPLLPGPRHREAITQLVQGARARSLDVAVVSNGYHLVDYLELLETASIRELQLTLDGPEVVHDARRPRKGGQPTFERIAAGIDLALARQHSVNLRVVVDRDNISALPALARLAEERGWLAAPGFKTQLGRNYELHCHQGSRAQLYSRLELYQDLHRLIEEHPEVLAFFRPAFHLARFLFDNGELPPPLFDACPACKTEWAFDGSGRIYSCTATVGKVGESLGTFYPQVQLDTDSVARWQARDVLAIDACKSCGVQLVCGGGCGAVAKNRTGSACESDCRPVAEMLELGMGLYFKGELREGQLRNEE